MVNMTVCVVWDVTGRGREKGTTDSGDGGGGGGGGREGGGRGGIARW